ncbi:MAG: hypothetical protein ACRCXL_07145 [Dermatophilaceae bacterium]
MWKVSSPWSARVSMRPKKIGGVRVVRQGGHPPGEDHAEELAGVRVASRAGVELVGGVAHPAQLVTRVVELRPLLGEDIGTEAARGGGRGGRRGRGEFAPPIS